MQSSCYYKVDEGRSSEN